MLPRDRPLRQAQRPKIRSALSLSKGTDPKDKCLPLTGRFDRLNVLSGEHFDKLNALGDGRFDRLSDLGRRTAKYNV